jgi:hypothetical protein
MMFDVVVDVALDAVAFKIYADVFDVFVVELASSLKITFTVKSQV